MKYHFLISAFLLIVGLSIIQAGDAELLSLPEDIKRIESESFVGISADRVYFPSGIEYIADDAFSGVSFIGEGAPDTYAQEWCLSHGYAYQAYSTPIDEFEWASVAGGISITKYNGNSVNVCIPSAIDNEDVISIGNNAFKDLSELKSVSFPNTLETIGQYAFYGCSSLKRVNLPDSVETIDKYAFMYCTSLESIHFSSNLDAINESAFQCCSSLKSIDLPDSLTYLGWRAFRECSSLAHFGYPVNIQEVGGVFLYDCISLKEVTVPEGVYKLMDFFIAGAGNVEKVNLPSTLEIIGKYAFAYDNAFTSITLPDSVETINEHAFYQCYNLQSIEFSNHLDRIEESAFQECTGLTSVDLPESLTYLGWHSFSDCSALTHFGYPIGIREVGGTFLTGCKSLKEVTVPEGVTRLMDYFVCNQGTVTTINLPSTLEEIGKYAFYGDNAFNTIEIPNGVKSIDEYAFAGNSNIVSIDIPASVTYIGIRAFEEATGLKSITFHDGLIGIDTYAFKGCSALKTISLPNTVTMLGCAVFENCTSLTTFNSSTDWNTLYVPGSMSTLAAQLGGPRGIFAGCTKLTTVTIPEGAECIPRYAFSYAPNLTTVNLPATIKTIGEGAFMEAKNLRTINFPDGLTAIGFGAFKNCSSLKAAELPDSVTTIGCYAFYNCTNLSSIHYPRNWTTVTSPSFYGDTWALALFACGNDYNIFGNDYKISSVNIPDGVQGIPPCAFQNCTGLKTVTIPDSVTQIMSKVFENCSSLPQIYISPNVTDLGNNIFNGCQVLTVWCEYGSAILQYCKDNSVDYYYLTPDGINSPSGTLYKGDSYGLHGYARASLPLIDVTATIWNSDKTEIIQTISIAPGVTDYSLTGEINANMLFGTLDLGNYHYTLTASTDLSEEQWANTSFSIVPPPLRVSVNGMPSLSGVVSNDFSLHGTINSNYPIANLTVILTNLSTGNISVEYSLSPNNKSFSLSNLNNFLNWANQPIGNYNLTILVSGNGEYRTPVNAYFSIGNYDGEIDNELYDQMISFVGNENNFSLFNQFNDGWNFISSLDAIDLLNLSWQFKSDMVKDKIKNVLTGDDLSRFKIKQYKKEILAIIDDLDPSTTLTNSDSTYNDFIQSMVSNSRIIFTQNPNDPFVSYYMLNMSKVLNFQFDKIDKLCDINSWIMNAKDYYSEIIQNFENSLRILEVYSGYNNINNAEMKKAIEEIAEDYSSKVLKSLHRLNDRILEQLAKQAFKEAIKLFGESVGQLYKIVTFAVDSALEFNGYDKVADSMMDVIIRVDTFGQALSSYRQAFSAVKNGDTSAIALNRLGLSYQLCCTSCYRMYDALAETAWCEREFNENSRLMEIYSELMRMSYREPFVHWRMN